MYCEAPLVVVERTTQSAIDRVSVASAMNRPSHTRVDDLVSRDRRGRRGRQEDQQIHHLRFEVPDRASVADEVERRLHQPTANVDVSRRRGPNLFAPHGLILDDSGGAGACRLMSRADLQTAAGRVFEPSSECAST
jgi:hypothetical protein